MLDTSPPRGNAFVTPGNIFLPLPLSLSRFSSLLLDSSSPFTFSLVPTLFHPVFLSPCTLSFPCATFDTEVQPSSCPSVPLRRVRSVLFYYTSRGRSSSQWRGAPTKYVPEFSGTRSRVINLAEFIVISSRSKHPTMFGVRTVST